jgi:hypothetical protein
VHVKYYAQSQLQMHTGGHDLTFTPVKGLDLLDAITLVSAPSVLPTSPVHDVTHTVTLLEHSPCAVQPPPNPYGPCRIVCTDHGRPGRPMMAAVGPTALGR